MSDAARTQTTGLTDADREALAHAVVGEFIDHSRHNPAHGLGVFDRSRCDRIVAPAVERIVAAAVEQERAAWAARIEALADEWSGCWCAEQMAPDHDPRVQDCPQHGDGSCQHTAEGITVDLRALLTPDSTAALDAVKAEAGRAALREAADELAALNTIGMTRRDLISDDDWLWFTKHPFREFALGNTGDVARACSGYLAARADQIGGVS